MKHMKKLASLLLALTLVFALATTAMAAGDTYSITINNAAVGHTYEAYQIFAGDLSGTTLSNIVWGSGISEDGKTTLGDAAAKAETLHNDSDAKEFAKLVAPYLSTVAGSANTVTEGKYIISGLAAGYYLVKDRDGSLTNANDSYTEYIIKVVSNTTANPKSSVPTVAKKVKDTNDSVAEPTTDWQDSADYDVGDSVPFLLKAQLADNVSSYSTYKVVFHDTLSPGLTYNNDAKVYIDGTKKDGFTVTCDSNGSTLTVSCDDVKALGARNGSVITVEYTATLNENAVLGESGNTNKVKLEYSNNPNKSESGDNETGNTPEDDVIVFSYKVVINKVTKNPNYNPGVEGSKEYIPLTGAEFTLAKKILGDNSSTAETETEYWKNISVSKNTDGTVFTFSGLDDGVYRLTETKTPAGYNTIEPIEFTITADHTNGSLTSLSGNTTTTKLTFTSDAAKGSLSADVINQSGSTLPETGGMGTTLFYVLGGILAVTAVVLLVTKKRMNSAE